MKNHTVIRYKLDGHLSAMNNAAINMAMPGKAVPHSIWGLNVIPGAIPRFREHSERHPPERQDVNAIWGTRGHGDTDRQVSSEPAANTYR